MWVTYSGQRVYMPARFFTMPEPSHVGHARWRSTRSAKRAAAMKNGAARASAPTTTGAPGGTASNPSTAARGMRTRPCAHRDSLPATPPSPTPLMTWLSAPSVHARRRRVPLADSPRPAPTHSMPSAGARNAADVAGRPGAKATAIDATDATTAASVIPCRRRDRRMKVG